MSEITILLLYVAAAATFGASRLPRFESSSRTLYFAAFLLTAIGITVHSNQVYGLILTPAGFNLSIGHVVSLVGLELALIALIAALEPTLRGISSGLLLLGAVAVAMTGTGEPQATEAALEWQARAHILIALLSYGLLMVGAIVALFALIQERRLRRGKLAPESNALFAPLETTERLLFGITTAGFAGLAIAITLGLTFVEDLFAQHLVHKSTLAILALVVFGVLLVGRWTAGWRGERAVKLYLVGFLLLFLAYFGSRFVLEQLSRSWS
ncbi:MAG: cytochrome c biogenesis protein CcsA [Pseudomonadota bacterium]